VIFRRSMTPGLLFRRSREKSHYEPANRLERAQAASGWRPPLSSFCQSVALSCTFTLSMMRFGYPSGPVPGRGRVPDDPVRPNDSVRGI
jgi:hypothetical protein